ncbi:MAG: SprB repeat-containing protein, partial [Crocinitomicaceae bacterium]|nr:SprB repeat-containing protein [Crocinitomicaceae bacterium]
MKNLYYLLLSGLLFTFFSVKVYACDGFQVNAISTTYIGGGVYEVTIEYCEEVSNGAGASVHGVLAIINGANIISTSTPSITSATTGVSMNFNQLTANSAEWGDWDNDAAPIFMDDGDPQECFTLVLQVDAQPTSVTFAGSSNATSVGSGFTQLNGRWSCNETVAFPPATCSASWTPPIVCLGSTGTIDLNTTTTGTGTFSGPGVNSGTGIFDPTGLSGTVSVTFTVGDALFNCSQTEDIQIVDLNPNLAGSSVCQGDCVDLDATVTGATVIPSCEYTLLLHDSWGDGWNGGANVDIYINGVLYLLNQTVAGSNNTITIPVQDGDLITLDYLAGTSFNSENSMTMYDANGAQVGYVSNPSTGFQGSGITVSCPGLSSGCNNYTLNMFDSFGDGWNGASVDILINGVFYTNASLGSGSSGSQGIPVSDGDVITLFYYGGSWDSEVSMTMLDGNGSQTGSTISNPPDGTQGQSWTISCPSYDITYTWTPTTGLSDPNIADPQACPTSNTSYNVDIYDPVSGCSYTDHVTITVVNPPNPNFTVSGNQCQGGSLTFTNTGTAGISYTWTFENGTPATATGSSVSGVTFSNVGSNDVELLTSGGSCADSITIPITIYANPIVNATVTNPACNGGSATVSASATNTSGYNYNWPPGLGAGSSHTVTSSGTYLVTVTDLNGCQDTMSVQVVIPTDITASITGTNLNCNGDANATATVTATGGTGGLSYNWSPAPGSGQGTASVGGLTAQTYTVTITDGNSCTETANWTPTQPTPISLSISGTNVSCQGGANATATVSATGGAGSYSYNWSPAPGGGQGTASVTGLTAQTYTVTVTDGSGCQQSISYTPTQPVALTGGIVSQSNVTCNGGNNGTVTVSGSNGTPTYSYNIGSGNQASGTFNGLSAGNYTVTITDNNNCTTTVPVTITQPTALSASIPAVTIDCNGDCDGQATVNASGGSGAYTYQWDNGTNDITATTAANLCAGTYNVTVADAADATCTTTASVTIAAPTAITSSITGTNITCAGLTNGTATVT